jgi:GNAT superfamily N-acetyltransferase
MAPTSFREPTEGDIADIRRVAVVAWRNAYRGIYAPSTIARKVAEFYTTESLAAAIRSSRRGDSFFLLALDGSQVVGYANGKRIPSQWRDPSKPGGRVFRVSGWELTRIYLLPDHIGRGVGKGLLERWESFLRAKRAKRYFVSYNAKNRLARDFYVRNGFTRARNYDDGPTRCAIKLL